MTLKGKEPAQGHKQLLLLHGPAEPEYLDGLQLPHDVHLRYFLLTIAVQGTDINVKFYRNRVQMCSEKRCFVGAIAVECWDIEYCLHYQGVIGACLPNLKHTDNAFTRAEVQVPGMERERTHAAQHHHSGDLHMLC